MIDINRFEEITMELYAELPKELKRELNGGVMVRESAPIHPEAVADDLFILGEYHRDYYLGRFVVIYYGSFRCVYGYLPEARIREEIWRVLRHEVLHHIESLAGERSLEIADAIQIAQYKEAHGEPEGRVTARRTRFSEDSDPDEADDPDTDTDY